jgi:hypothetical protein
MTLHLYNELTGMADFISENSSSDPDLVLKTMGEKWSALTKQRRTSEDRVLSASVEALAESYRQREENTGYKGIPYPWDVLNYETGGMLESEFVVFYGRPKSMKTWVLLSCACNAYDRGSRRVLVCTREMTPMQILERCICILVGAPYSAFRHGTLKDIPVPEGGTMRDRFYGLLDTVVKDEEVCTLETGHSKGLIITSDRADPEGGGVMGLRQKVEDHKPDLLCVDAMYLLKDEGEGRQSFKWDKQAAISRDLKDLALDFCIPVLGTNQAKRDSEERPGRSVANVAFSDSYGQMCDLAIEILKKSTRDKEVNELAMAITAAREINMTGFAIHGNAATDFGQLMTKKRDDTGVVIMEDGEPVMEPVIFQEPIDVKDFFKDDNVETNPQSKAVQDKLAREAWQKVKGGNGEDKSSRRRPRAE